MKTPPMFYPQEDGKLVEIPEEHAAILELYRDRMPVAFEVQEYNQPMLYPLIDVDAEPPCSPLPGTLETAAQRVAQYLRGKRIGEDPVVPDFERLARAAAYAYIADAARFASDFSYDQTPARRQRAVEQDARQAGRNLTKTIERAVRETIAETAKEATA